MRLQLGRARSLLFEMSRFIGPGGIGYLPAVQEGLLQIGV